MVVCVLGLLAGSLQMDWCCCHGSANVHYSSLVIDMNYTESHARLSAHQKYCGSS